MTTLPGKERRPDPKMIAEFNRRMRAADAWAKSPEGRQSLEKIERARQLPEEQTVDHWNNTTETPNPPLFPNNPVSSS